MAQLRQTMRRLLEHWWQLAPEYDSRCRNCGVCRHVCTLLRDKKPQIDAAALED